MKEPVMARAQSRAEMPGGARACHPPSAPSAHPGPGISQLPRLRVALLALAAVLVAVGVLAAVVFFITHEYG
jgi:hypothetical protein